jgi:hypothetical protein
MEPPAAIGGSANAEAAGKEAAAKSVPVVFMKSRLSISHVPFK